jgi:uncharacterized lipoprotein NlpE involved in copper resistance
MKDSHSRALYVTGCIIVASFVGILIWTVMTTFTLGTTGCDERKSQFQIDDGSARQSDLEKVLRCCYVGNTDCPASFCQEQLKKLTGDPMTPPLQ